MGWTLNNSLKTVWKKWMQNFTHIFQDLKKTTIFFSCSLKKVEEWTYELIRNPEPQGASARNTGKGILTIPTSLDLRKCRHLSCIASSLKHKTWMWPRNSTARCMPQRNESRDSSYSLIHVRSSIIHGRPKVETIPCPPTGEWIDKM